MTGQLRTLRTPTATEYRDPRLPYGPTYRVAWDPANAEWTICVVHGRGAHRGCSPDQPCTMGPLGRERDRDLAERDARYLLGSH